MALAVYPLRHWPLGITIAAAMLIYAAALLLTGSITRAEIRRGVRLLAGRRSGLVPRS
jgi:hypothetical protein